MLPRFLLLIIFKIMYFSFGLKKMKFYNVQLVSDREITLVPAINSYPQSHWKVKGNLTRTQY